MVRRAAIRFGSVSGAARSAWPARLRLILLLLGCSAGLRGDQREPAIELYGLAGG